MFTSSSNKEGRFQALFACLHPVLLLPRVGEAVVINVIRLEVRAGVVDNRAARYVHVIADDRAVDRVIIGDIHQTERVAAINAGYLVIGVEADVHGAVARQDDAFGRGAIHVAGFGRIDRRRDGLGTAGESAGGTAAIRPDPNVDRPVGIVERQDLIGIGQVQGGQVVVGAAGLAVKGDGDRPRRVIDGIGDDGWIGRGVIIMGSQIGQAARRGRTTVGK